ncbi:hypothetical protein B0A52_09146 [Exophiala mesophila]|uniref:Major facilitator superfamily (MFS) profile domain-containing protein n=1 Tax=Exophiala mesophila TaxID=212818 RepID=A0A438MUF2_EXOME|nr:hypothetical protein B0A52_09146 [Exophiala mesophila]
MAKCEHETLAEDGQAGHTAPSLRSVVEMHDRADEVSIASGPVMHDSIPLMDLSRGVIGWESKEDVLNPRNWRTKDRRTLMLLMSIIATISPMASSLCAPGIADTMADLHEPSRVLGSLMITIFVLGYAVGPLFLAPLSEMYGRYPVVVISTWFFTVWLLGCSFAPSMSSLIVMRFLAGVGGSGIITISPAIVGDLYPVERRAFGSAIIIGSQSTGPIIGPIAGGFITQYLGWRWSYWILVICASAITGLTTVFMKESNAVVLLEKKVKRLRKVLGRNDLYSPLQPQMSPLELVQRSLLRPLKLLVKSPIVLLMSVFVATAYALLYLMFTTIPTVFEDTYGWSAQLAGLAYLGLGIGTFIALIVLMKFNDAQVVKLMRQNNMIFERERAADTDIEALIARLTFVS